jgi:hypothetical protein
VLQDAGFVRVTSFAARRIRSIVLLLTVCSSVLLMRSNVIASFSDTGHFPEAPVVADFLATQMSHGDEVVIKTPADAPLRFYMWYKGLPWNESPLASGKKFFVVKKSRYTLRDLTEHNARRILAIGDAEVYVLDLR